jgi:hypothetical protein
MRVSWATDLSAQVRVALDEAVSEQSLRMSPRSVGNTLYALGALGLRVDDGTGTGTGTGAGAGAGAGLGKKRPVSEDDATAPVAASFLLSETCALSLELAVRSSARGMCAPDVTQSALGLAAVGFSWHGEWVSALPSVVPSIPLR